MTDPQNEKTFMREKIVKPKQSKKQMAGRLVCLFLFAVIFGIVAAVSFVVSKPMAEKLLGEEPEPSTEPITIERDVEQESTEAVMETMEPTVPETTPEHDAEEIREIVKEEVEQIPMTPDKVKEWNQVLRDIGNGAGNSIVTVSSEKYQKDWFDNPVIRRGQYAGIILAVNTKEVVILTEESALQEADSLQIVFGDGTSVSGTVKQTDAYSGLAVISANVSDLSDVTKKWIGAIELGNSYSVSAGDMLIAVGSPAGPVYSVKNGTVSYVAKNVQTADGHTRVFYADMTCDKERGTFFLNLSGQLVGWATSLFDEEESEGMTKIMSLSEYKGNLQKLTNGAAIPYVGIKGQEVSALMQMEGIPSGIYITESIADGPAYSAGIQNGDILKKINGIEVTAMRDYQNVLENLESGMEISVVVERKGINEYKEIEYRVTIGAR